MSTSNRHQQSLADAGSETRHLMLERGSYIPWASHFIRMQIEEDLIGDDLKHYEAEIEGINLILISITNDIYNSVDACTTAQAMWQLVEREALVLVYNYFAQLMNDLERNDIKFPKVTVNTKFLNCLQPKWLKYVTQVRLAKRLTKDSYDDLFDYLSQYEKLVNASRAKTLEKSHDPLALVAHTGDAFQNNSEDLLTSAMMLLARAITQRFSNPTNNRLRTSSNTRNQAIIQADKNDFLVADATRMEEIKELSANICLMARIQPSNIDSDARLSYDCAFLNEVQTSSTNYVNSLFAKDNQEQNGSVEYDNNVQKSYELKQLAGNAYKEAEKQQIITKKVQQQNTVLTKQLESYKEKVRVFEMTKGNNTTFLNEFIEADRKERRLEKDLQTQFIRNQDIIQDLEQQQDKLQLSVVELKRQIVELQKTQTILKRKMSENKDKYYDIAIDLEARAKKNED
ncbi:hypothetical protein Tco_0734650 [Tanacetum coccineum]